MRCRGTSCKFTGSRVTPRGDTEPAVPTLLPATKVLTPHPEASTPTGDRQLSPAEGEHFTACRCTKWQGNNLVAPLSEVRGERPSRQVLARGDLSGDGDRAILEAQQPLAVLLWVSSSASAAAAEAAATAAATANASAFACMDSLSPSSSSLLPAPNNAWPSKANRPEAIRPPCGDVRNGDGPDFRVTRGDGLRDPAFRGNAMPSVLTWECGQASAAAPEAGLPARKVSTNLPAGSPRTLPLGLRGTAALSSGCKPTAPSREPMLLALLNLNARA